MIAGHAAVALAAKVRWPRIPVALLLVATFFPDVLDALLFWTVQPADFSLWSHALIVVVPAAVLFVLSYGVVRRDYAAGWILAGIVMSHWVLDLITGAKLTWPGGPVLGLGLYFAEWPDPLIEVALVVAAWLYARRRATGLLADWRLYAALVFVQLGSNAYGWWKHAAGLPADVLNAP